MTYKERKLCDGRECDVTGQKIT